jgi:hypothetical protein
MSTYRSLIFLDFSVVYPQVMRYLSSSGSSDEKPHPSLEWTLSESTY